MSQSSLVNVKMITKHFGYPTGKSGRGGAKIDKIFVHHMAGILTVEQCGNVFKNREASAHYGIDGKGRVGQYVLEENTAWHCANKAYNQRSIGIELSNDGGAKTNWHVADKTVAKCIDLIVDICKRNGINKINYTGNLKGNLCMHCWTASTSCPAPYLKSKFKYIAEQVNKKLKATPAKEVLYRVRKTWTDAKSQVGAYKNLANAKKVADEKHLNVYDDKGKLVYEGKKKDEQLASVKKLLAKAKEYCWAKGTPQKKWQYSTGAPLSAYKTACKKHMNKSSKESLSDCGYFIDTCVRAAGLGSKFLVLKGNKDPFPAPPSNFKIVHTGAIGSFKLQAGDIIRYKKTNGAQHTLMIYDGSSIAEAGRKTRFPVIRSDSKKYNASDVKKNTLQVLRLVK